MNSSPQRGKKLDLFPDGGIKRQRPAFSSPEATERQRLLALTSELPVELFLPTRPDWGGGGRQRHSDDMRFP